MKTNLLIKILSIGFLTFMIGDLFSQIYPVGTRDITFHDPARNRNIGTKVYYPATNAGNNQPMAQGEFPLLVMGHGFSMGIDAYVHYGDSLARLGFILVLPTTEGGLSPNHGTFGLDLRFLNTHIKGLNNDNTSIFYQKLSGKSAIMGHSMGGGSSMLAAANNTDITTLVNFAAAETNPSAIAAAANISVPVVMWMGTNDGVTPPNEHVIPMYNNLGTACKTRISILGGGHCFFALSNWACDFGESTTNPKPTITRSQQHQTIFRLLIPYLKYMLMDDATAEALYYSRLFTATDVSYERNCPFALDLELSDIISPVTSCALSNQSTVSVKVKNVGLNTINNFDLSYVFNNGNTVTENIDSTLEFGDEYVHTFLTTVDASIPSSNNVLNAWVNLIGDEFTYNDTLTSLIENTSIALPSSVDFTGFTGANLHTAFPGWREAQGITPAGTNSTWINRTGLGGTTNTTAKVNFTGTTIREWIISPAFVPTNNTRLDFDIALTAYNSTNSYATGMAANDELRIMISTDCGNTWSLLHSYGNSAGLTNTLTNKQIDLSTYSGQGVAIAFLAWRTTSSSNNYDIHIDNILIKNYLDYDLSISGIDGISSYQCFSDSENFEIVVENLGINSIDFSSNPLNINIEITGANPQLLEDIINSGIINSGQIMNISLNQPAALSNGGSNIFNIVIENDLDINLTNNSLSNIEIVSINPNLSIVGINQICLGQEVELSTLTNSYGTVPVSKTNATTYPIPDNNPAGVESPIAISGTGLNASEVLTVVINELVHTYTQDLVLYLIAPNGSQIILSDKNGGNGDNYINTVFSMTATTPISSGSAPFTGSYLPHQAFTSLTGIADGTWKLKAVDNANQDVGAINSWTINFIANNKIISYEWNTGQITDTILNSPTETTTYTVVVTDMLGCSSSEEYEVQVIDNNDTINFPDEPTFICQGDTITFDLSGFDTYLWHDASTNNYYSTNISENIYVTVTNICGEQSAETEVIANPLPIINLGNDESICSNQSLLLDAGTGFEIYEWSIGSSTNNELLVDVNLFTGSQTIYVIVTDTNSCVGTDSILITINDLPIIDFGFSDTTLCHYDELVLNAGSGYENYLWSIGSSTTNELVVNQALFIGTQTISVEVTDANGCIGQGIVNVTIDICGSNNINLLQNLTIYPNPSNGVFVLKLPEINDEVIVHIFNELGQIFVEKQIFNNETTFNLSNFNKGIYFIKLNINGNVHTGKIVIK